MAPSTDWKEVIPPGEDEALLELAEQVREIQRTSAQGRPASRALHAKPQAGVEAEFTVHGGLPEYARIGLFAQPRTYRAYARFSNGAPRRQRDQRGDVRGLAFKVLGVEGRKLIPGMEAATTQDFLLIQSASTPFVDAAQFVWFLHVAAQPALLPLRLFGKFGPLGGLRMLRRLLAHAPKPIASVATTRYFSALPTRFGPYAARYSLRPLASPKPGAAPGDSPNYLGEELAARLAEGMVSYDFQAQFFQDEARTPIEDASKDWSEQDAPYLTLGTLTLPQQQLKSPRGQKISAFVETLSFDPWHALEELRPLGNMMRARNPAYRLSTQERGAAGEPDGTERFD